MEVSKKGWKPYSVKFLWRDPHKNSTKKNEWCFYLSVNSGFDVFLQIFF